ncbi:unnamed protein product [Spodoptera littoralis]|uniref:Lipase domain-containing protein n=1 Tax=Spodoptera littoralis TaxID=7109 RepID=A0A9P0I3L6_SPOLI|nr:unnamed protein product [Spodoptera littoralis]CAH1639581.1 unnamed protein product [Spodoptera littoralis]
MKFLVALATLIALSAGSAIPLVPGDNSHYVEGESRYIWMPDGEGKPHLVDLHEPVDERAIARNGANNQYWLYTRENPSNAQIIVHGNVNSITSSNYRANRGLKVIVHGWNNNGNTAMNPLITSAFLAVQDVNVIVVDWQSLANSNYLTASNGVPGIGQFLGNFLVWLISTAGGDWNNVHLVGFSLGAHVVGNAGRQAGGRPARVTGLDPAGPLWGGNSLALNANAGQYVEAIHTDGGLLGIFDRIAHGDFIPMVVEILSLVAGSVRVHMAELLNSLHPVFAQTTSWPGNAVVHKKQRITNALATPLIWAMALFLNAAMEYSVFAQAPAGLFNTLTIVSK